MAQPIEDMSKRRTYSSDAVFAAVDFAKENKNFSVRKIAREFGVPETTLRNKINGKFGVKISLGRPPVINFPLEQKLADHCAFMAQMGYGYTKWQVLDIAMELAKASGVSDKFRNDKPSKHWFNGFVNRFPHMIMRKPQKLERVRALCVSPSTVDGYYKELKSTLVEIDLFDKPSRVWNIDETGITCDYNPPKILASRYTESTQ
ncbi:uncharacterized protein LOC123533097 [Mercenaria mercenaria]|uniref:uncharacterized protein LOC123533097 n=1 Tax=Mercenaria mercenaria TaxID=6596 RepID=UPI00234E4C5E|nr:uncharacterized protein LOC123533097 [Mercenaria mercenaria]